MIGALSNALQGLFSASQNVTKAANNIANASTEGYRTETGDQVDLSTEAINLKIAETAYRANLATIKTAGDMNDELMKMFDETV